jgi:competence ComEA-like helix-hairpin-helix protein
MPLSLSNRQAEYEQKKDDRLIILLGIGVFLLLYFILQLNISPLSSGKEIKLQLQEGRIVIYEKGLPPLLETQGEGADSLIPAALTPFFFAPLPINEADQDLLETLSGIGPHLAAEIIKTREKRGPFRHPEDLLNIRGIGEKRMLKFADQFSYR